MKMYITEDENYFGSRKARKGIPINNKTQNAPRMNE